MRSGRGARAEPHRPARPAPARGATTACLLLCLCAALACGRKGDPIAPEQRLPEPPPRLQLSGENGTLVVSWAAPRRDRGGDTLDPVAGYRVWRGTWPPGATGSAGECPSCPQEMDLATEIDAEALGAAGRDPTRWTDPRAEPDWTYRYQVQALGQRGRPGPLSAPASITWAELPAPRFTLSSQDRSALATFTPPAWPAGLEPVGYRLYDAGGRPVAEGEPASNRVTVAELANDVEVELTGHLAGRTLQGWVIEGPGGTARVTPMDRVPPLPPSDLTPFVGPASIELRWLPAGDEPYHRLYVLRGEGEESLTQVVELPGDALVYRDLEVRPGQRYFYTVVSSDAAGNRSLQPRAVSARRSGASTPWAGEKRP
ncbi:MAG TPA: fibronectin type III domain-containing protein [Deferrisomatales bacterium]|nr:fibronectin type III domain-containing protein [Deferrisomatales bacterium]